MATVELLVIVYGSCARDPENDLFRFTGADQRRVEITLNPVLPEGVVTMNQKHQWLQGFLMRIGVDMKHNKHWRCEFCKKHARETTWMNASWMHLDPPRANCYVHSLCDAGSGPCSDRVRETSAELAKLTGSPPSALPRVTKPAGTEYPMLASCAVCNNEAPEARKNLKQCAKCALTRYCSIDCQRVDWKRHKECCKVVKEVKWYWE